jgi:putative DNA primase/helicase
VSLSIPAIDPESDVLSAALLYAKSGWYVLPVHPETKRPDLPKGWPTMTSNDPEQIVAWFAGTDSQLGLHVGRSGAVVFDVDNPDVLPERLDAALSGDVPFQSTRFSSPRRGHYVFAQPPGRRLGNSRGEFSATPWGEVRGQNGIIVVSPSRHSKSGGRYAWQVIGRVPRLPSDLDASLPDMQDSESVASDAQVKAFLEANVGTARPSLMTAIGRKFTESLTRGSRHEALVDALAWGLREAKAGFFPAQSVVDMLLPDFERALRGESGRNAAAEFRGVLAWAVAQAEGTDGQVRAAEVAARIAPSTRIASDGTPVTPPGNPTGTLTPAQVRKTSAVQMKARQVRTQPPPRQASDYFGKDGLDAALLAQDVMNMGELAYGTDNAFWIYEGGVWKSDPKVVISRVVYLLQGRFRKSHAENAAIIVQHSVNQITCEPTPDFINFTNGMLNWRTGEILPHAPHYGSTVQLPVAWEPEAQAPVFEKFLSDILTPDYKRFAWEMIGYLMMSGNPLQCAFLLLGTGSNGKGTLMRVITDLLGHENCSAISLDALTQNRFAPAGLFGRLANIAGDIDATYQENTAPFKMLTGEDTYNAERKYGEDFRFQNWAVPVFSANKVPGSSDTTNGYLRRWKIIEFSQTISEKDAIPGFSETLAQELPGIAAIAIAHLMEVMGRNQGKGGFLESEEIAAGKERFAESIDQVRQWLDDATQPYPDRVEPLSVVYRHYKEWAIEQGNKPLKSSEFDARLRSMEHLGVKSTKINGKRIVKHIGLVARSLAAPNYTIDPV